MNKKNLNIFITILFITTLNSINCMESTGDNFLDIKNALEEVISKLNTLEEKIDKIQTKIKVLPKKIADKIETR